MKKFLVLTTFLLFFISTFGDDKPKNCGVTGQAGASATIINPAVIGLDTITKKISDTIKEKTIYFYYTSSNFSIESFLLRKNVVIL